MKDKMSLNRLTYMSRPTSRSSAEFASNQRDIVMKARENNRRDGLSGALLGNESWFVQVLEGKSQKALAAMYRILGDVRHTDVVLFEMEIVKERMFAEWAMLYSSLDDVPPKMVWDCVDNFRDGSISGGKSAIHLLTRAAEETVGSVAQ